MTIDEIKKEVDRKGIKVDWTLTSEAAEYREILMIEKEIAEGESESLRQADIVEESEFEEEIA